MNLLDTMLIVYARTPSSPFHEWAVDQIADAVSSGDGAGLSAVSLAELCPEDGVSAAEVTAAVSNFGVQLLDVPSDSAARCGEAYRSYRQKRKVESGRDAPRTPLPDFFIGAHAELLGCRLITNDPQRFVTYFPKVDLVKP
jgi:hypothetical protein